MKSRIIFSLSIFFVMIAFVTCKVDVGGMKWKIRDVGLGNVTIMAVTKTDTQFVAVGNGNIGVVVTSPNGEVWKGRYPGTSSWLSSVIYTGSQLVAVGATGTIITSSDGITWASRDSKIPSAYFRAVSQAGSQLIVVGEYESRGVIVSSDDGGLVWVNRFLSDRNYSSLWSTAYNGKIMVVVGGGILSSIDGINWTNWSGSAGLGETNMLSSVVWTGNQFVAVGKNGTILTSEDGITWSYIKTESGATLTSVTWTGKQIVAVGNYRWENQIRYVALTSQDGITWSQEPSTTSGISFITSIEGNLLAVGSDGKTILISP